MKIKILLLIIFLSCSDEQYHEEIGEIHNYNFPNSIEVENIADTIYWVRFYLSYKVDVVGDWQTPEESYLLETGDCEDYAILIMYLLIDKLNIESYLIVGQHRITSGGHALIYIPSTNLYYDPLTCYMMSYEILDSIYIIRDEFSWPETIWLAIHRY